MSDRTIRMIIADDQVLVREGIRAILESVPGFRIAALAENGQEALGLVREIPCDLVLLDIRMPLLDGIDTCRCLKSQYPELIVAMLTNFADAEEVIGAIQAGADGYLLKDIPSDELITSLRSLASGKPVVSPQALEVLLEAMRQPLNPSRQYLEDAHLTPREVQILEAIIQGASNKSIAEQFSLAEGTVRNHVSRIYEKLGVRDRIQVIMLARKNGWFAS